MGFKLGQRIIDFFRGKKNNQEEVNYYLLNEELEKIKYIFLPAIKKHSETFTKYKNMYLGKNIVLIGSGPTLKYYNKIENAVHIGVNHTFTCDSFYLDYLFVQDNLSFGDKRNPDMQQRANSYRKGLCKKIYGVHYEEVCCIPEVDCIDSDAERYYFLDHPVPVSGYPLMNADITARPLNEWSSVIFAALEFALWTHPKRIYIVGCDASANGHIYFDDESSFCAHSDRLIYGWKQFKRYIDMHYPDIEVISINPVGLKGLFKDMYTKEYVDVHPELLKDKIEIINKEIVNVK